jgi:demethylmenaquinone methyltransferase/2-methoxy-6-polyprenyl-1,4-benzoquinol methylase
MRFLESAPGRYDAGMRLLTLGRLGALHEAVAVAAIPRPGVRVLEVGCGTGLVTARLVARGARVTALDQNAEMLERARTRLGTDAVVWRELAAAEIDTLPRDFDAVVASLCLSEMSQRERGFVLREAGPRLRPGGRLVVADEVVPRGRAARGMHALLRAPQAALGWLLAGSLSRPTPFAASS